MSPPTNETAARARLALPLIYLVFLASGFAALVYQVAWQRALFALFGIDIESVTLVVTAFMLGLGIGSWIGGALSARSGRPVLLYFAAFELGIGLFGLVSLPLFRTVGALTAGASGPATFAITLALVVVPTSMMGATLPLLVAHVVEELRNVGRSVGNLYFVNTLGSAIASIATAIFLMRYLGLQGSVWFAAAINIAAGTFILVAWFRGRRA